MLVAKARAGAQFAITQLFFNARDYFELVDRVAGLRCGIPVIPGIMPITNVAQFQRFATLSGSQLPSAIVERFESVQDEPAAVRAMGVEIASQLCERLLDGGAPGLHFYTLNRSTATREIYANLSVGIG